jgi:cell division GTPase FtsZ
MGDLESLVRTRATEIENELRPRLRGIRGVFVRATTPKVIVYKTATEAVTVLTDKHGNVSVVRGAHPKPKILVESTYEIIAESFRTRDPSRLPPGPLVMTMRFWWGKRTFDPRSERAKR